jgi:hypothetical protein
MRLKPALLLVLLAGCSPPVEDTGVIVGDVLIGGLHRPRPLEQALGPNGHHIIFVNFDGVTLGANYDDSVHNQSSIAGGVGHSITVPPFNSTDLTNQFNQAQVIDDVINKAREFFADFNVDLVTQRPASPDYVMCAVGGDPSLIGAPCSQGGCVAGIAPLDCQPTNQGIDYNPNGDIEVVFAFSAVSKMFGGSYQEKVLDLATTIAQETAHSYGLGHTQNPMDVMNPYESGMTVGFESGAYADSNNCANGVGNQDSHALLLQILGKSQGPQDAMPPTVTLTQPTNGATLPRSFTIAATASDNVGVDHVVLKAGGPGTTFNMSIMTAPYTAPVTLNADGTWTISATAFDAAGNQAAATATVTVTMNAKLPFGAACTMPAQCQSGVCNQMICTMACGTGCPMGYTCNAQMLCERAKMAPQPGEVGATCTSNSDCHAMLCAELAGKHFCTAPCTVGDPNSCPAGMVCVNFGADGTLCSFPTGNGGSSCTVAPRGAPAEGGLWLLLSLLAPPLLLRARRRR